MILKLWDWQTMVLSLHLNLLGNIYQNTALLFSRDLKYRLPKRSTLFVYFPMNPELQ